MEDELDQYAKALLSLTAQAKPTASELQAIGLLTILIEQHENRTLPSPSATPVEFCTIR